MTSKPDAITIFTHQCIYKIDNANHLKKQLHCFCLFVRVEALRPSQQFFKHVGMFSLVEPILSNSEEVSCSRTQHHAPSEIQTNDLVITSPALYQLS